ncbi:hypothetical protein ES703_28423 [subsurface metagenome]
MNPEVSLTQRENPTMTLQEWKAKGKRLFGNDTSKWKFKCPACGHVQTPQDFKALKVDPNLVYRNCIGRYDGHMDVDMGTKPGPCNYTSGGLININPVPVVDVDGNTKYVFAFAEEGHR